MVAIGHLQTNETIRIVTMGFGALAIEQVKGILASPEVARIVGILPASNVPKYHFLRQHPSEIALLELAAEHELNLLGANSVNSPAFIKELQDLDPHILLIGGWSEIIKSPLLQLEDLAIINCHGSLLPKYRGACPILATIFNGDEVTGYTFHLIDEGVDTGDILFQRELKIQKDETTLRLNQRIASKFGETIIPLIQALKAGTIVPRKQTGNASYVPAQNPEWGWIPWEADPKIIDQRMRALQGFLPLATSVDNVVIGFESGQVVKLEHGFNLNCSLRQMSRYVGNRPGVVLESGPENILVTTVDPAFVVELKKPVFAPTLQEIPEIQPGTQFYSIACSGILKSA